MQVKRARVRVQPNPQPGEVDNLEVNPSQIRVGAGGDLAGPRGRVQDQGLRVNRARLVVRVKGLGVGAASGSRRMK